MQASGIAHGAEFRRCLIQLDIPGLMKVWAHVAPHLANSDPRRALISAHMARVEMKKISPALRDYSIKWLADEANIRKIDGKWVEGVPKAAVIAEAVGISSRSLGNVRTALNGQVELYMLDGLETARAKGVTEPSEQKAAMMKRRADYRFKKRLI
jgi:hypothetical protein